MTQPPTPFTRTLWGEIDPLFRKILAHPFVAGLTSGALEAESFRFYIIQDALYLREFAHALSIAAAKAPTEDAMILLNEHAAGVLRDEKALHTGFFRDWGISEADIHKTRMAPTNLAYTNYLLATAYTRPFHEILAAVLPCDWIYWEVGTALQKQGSREPAYQRWIDTYGGEEFARLARAMLALTDDIAQELDAPQRQAMSHHFVITSRYEWMFWEMAHTREQWPVT
uniref:Aminopyrimidine aminohydrolase n=1 Tax=Candidatus Kentrum sp. FW TaxID=2126338 RepID=A0A450TCD9_9GAMM|nr:MAG: thiaminase /4-amino-5-aminomethyl-2-methylpyrimidine deaminase [Candidatus Kentron sp. FW]